MAEVPVWVLDTNVLVSGLLSPFGPPGRLVDALLARRLRLAFDDRIELEYREVLARSRFGIAQAWQDAFFRNPAIPGTCYPAAMAAPSPA